MIVDGFSQARHLSSSFMTYNVYAYVIIVFPDFSSKGKEVSGRGRAELEMEMRKLVSLGVSLG